MGKKKKAFIDKKRAHNFQLVHRSQRDPLQADEDSSKHVLLPIDSVNQESDDTDTIEPSESKRSEELRHHGISYKDDYDYLQHLRTRTDCSLEPLPSNVTVIENKKTTKGASKEFGTVKLPSEVFASAYEEEEGLLNLAAPAPGPHPEWDPDIVAALDDDLDLEDEDNVIEDDFISKANATVSDNFDSDDDDDDNEEYFPSDEGGDDENDSQGGGFFFDDEETKSRFTSYSMTSSVIRRNDGLTLLDDKFEKIMEEYDEDEIGALDHEELAGTVDPDSHILNAIAEEFIQKQSKVQCSEMAMELGEGSHNSNSQSRQEKGQESDGGEDHEELIRMSERPKEKWDCESIMSTYSNLYNHPTLIKEPSKAKTIKLSKKTGIPIGVLSKRGSAKDSDKAEADKMDTSRSLTVGPKPRHEDKEEKRLRKTAVKDERRVRRTEKKANKLVFKAEHMRQESSLLHSKLQQGLKL